jgi:uncharacterized protein YhaN
VRFDRLELIRWGALADVTLDLSGGSFGLHVVYGDNEAGKSTTRRAISALLFGVPGQSPDRFRFDYRSLRVGARLRLADGTPFAFQRRKGTKDTFLDPDGAPSSDALLRRALGGVDRETFEQEWSLDHPRLRAGGAALLQGEGELGQSLLGAGLGGIGVGALLTELEGEAKEVFGKRGSVVARLLEQIKERRRARDAHAVSVTQALGQRVALVELLDARRAVDEERRARTHELARLERVEKAHPVLRERDRLADELARLEGVPIVGADFGKRRVMEQAAFDRARLEHERAERDVALCDERAAAVVIDHAVLSQASAIDALHSGLLAHKDREKQLASSEAERARAEREIAAKATSIGLDRATLVALARGPYRVLHDRARELAGVETEIRANLLALRASLRSDEAERSRLEAALGDLGPPPPDDAPLQKALERARSEVTAATRNLALLRETAERAAAEARGAFEALPRWARGPLGRRALETAQLPSVRDIDACEERLKAEAVKDAAKAREARAGEEARERGLAVAELGGAEVPTAAAVADARAERESAWRLVRAALERRPTGKAAVKDDGLADAYEAAVASADSLADRMHAGAARTVKLAAALEEKAAADARWAAARDESSSAVALALAAKAEWMALWQPLAIEPGSPRAMRAWVASAEEVRRLFQVEIAAQADLDAGRRAEDEALAPLAALLGSAVSGRSADEILTEAGERVERAALGRRQREEIGRELSRARTRVEEQEKRLADEVVREAAWAEEWGRFARSVGGSGRAPREVMAELAMAAEVAAALEKIDDLERSLEAGRRQRDDYLAEARACATAAGAPDAPPADVTALVRSLHDRLSVARAREQERAAERQRGETARRRRADEAERLEIARAALERLCDEAGQRTLDLQELARIERANDERRELKARLDRADAELAMVATDGTASLRAEVSAVSLVDVPMRRRATEEAKTAKDDEMNAMSQSIGALENELKKVTGGADAAEDESEIQGLIAAVGEASQELLRLAFAADLLRQATESYRQKNQSPILRRTSALFERLTLGSFLGVEVDEDDRAMSIIKGVRRDPHELVAVEGMSDGVRDQLFLALRLAIDDILINLSDARARATLDVLGEVATATQVLLFTHHSRVVELAESLVGREVFVHELSRSESVLG